MINRRRIVLNVSWNWAGLACSMLAGFVVAPFLVDRLGEHGYGLWVLIGSLTGYFSLLDLGVRGSVGRNMAFCRARNDASQTSAILGTAMALLAVPATLALAGSAGLALIFFDLFDVPADQSDAVRLALLLTGVHLSLSILLSTFDAVLWSMQRFDLINLIDIPVTLVRVGLTFALVDGEHGLERLAQLTLLSTVLAGAAKAAASFAVDRSLRIGPGRVTADTVRILLNFGIWSWLQSLTRMITTQCGPLLLGARLGVDWVTPYSLAVRLVGLATSLLVAASGVLTPVATALHATARHEQQHRLLLDGSKLCLALALFFLTFFVFQGDTFLRLWLRADMPEAYVVLVILAAGEVLPLSQLVGSSMIIAIGRHRLLALAGLVENGAVVILGSLWIAHWGLAGMAAAAALAAFACRGIWQMIFACRVVGLPIRRYLVDALLPAVETAAPPAVLLAVLTVVRPVAGWLDMIGYLGIFALAYAGSALLCLGIHFRPRAPRDAALEAVP
jgi:O-antigen/teichoic acid export membrane protein